MVHYIKEPWNKYLIRLFDRPSIAFRLERIRLFIAAIVCIINQAFDTREQSVISEKQFAPDLISDLYNLSVLSVFAKRSDHASG